VPKERGTVANS